MTGRPTGSVTSHLDPDLDRGEKEPRSGLVEGAAYLSSEVDSASCELSSLDSLEGGFDPGPSTIEVCSYIGSVSGLQPSQMALPIGVLRPVVAPPFLCRTLREWWMLRGQPDEGLVLPGLNSQNYNKRHLRPAAKKARVADVTAHGLRHTYATLLLSAGFRIDYISRQLRHRSTQITEREYAQWLHEDDVYIREPELTDGAVPADKIVGPFYISIYISPRRDQKSRIAK